MRILFTGASSKLGRGLLARLAEAVEVSEVWCGVHRAGVPEGGKVRAFPLRLEEAVDLSALPSSADLVVHCAGVTYAHPEDYDDVNRAGTIRLTEAAWASGCRRMAYVSTRCIGPGSGAYGESKRLAEEALLRRRWDSLLILRPAEVYGAGGDEGIDRLLSLGRDWRIAALLSGDPRISFSPIHVSDLADIAARAVLGHRHGVKVLELCGPERLSGVEVGLRIARLHRALPLPLWLPLLRVSGRLAACLGLRLFAPDQLDRLVGGKSSDKPSDDPIVGRTLRRFPGG